MTDIFSQAVASVKRRGFHDTANVPEWMGEANVMAQLARLVEEVGEVARAFRKDAGVGEELADVVIVVAQIAHMLGVDLEAAIIEKLAADEGRGYLHGGPVQPVEDTGTIDGRVQDRKVFAVRVVSAPVFAWYHQHIGDEFDVVKFGHGDLVLAEDYYGDHDAPWRHIIRADVRMVTEAHPVQDTYRRNTAQYAQQITAFGPDEPPVALGEIVTHSGQNETAAVVSARMVTNFNADAEKLAWGTDTL